MDGAAKNKVFIAIIATIIAAVVFGVWWFFEQKEKRGVKEGIPTGAIPGIESAINPLENVPDLNPVEKANPFKGLYKNPFE